MIASVLALPLLLQPLGGSLSPAATWGPPPRVQPSSATVSASAQEALDLLAAQAPDFARRLTLGASRGGRTLAALELAEPDLAPGSPALLIVGGLEGPRTIDTQIVLDHARRLVAGRRDGAEVDALFDSWRVVLVPSVALDAAELRDLAPAFARYGAGPGIDNDRDGRVDEDAPSDVDGDGRILWMRVPDPAGTWLADPHDSRGNIEADASLGQRGAFRLVLEGRDTDGDGAIGEDGPGDARTNSNFAAGWPEHSAEAGAYATSDPVVRALCDFVVARPDITLVLGYGSLDEWRKLPDGVDSGGRPPKAGLLKDDVATLKPLSEAFGELVEGKASNEGSRSGSFQAWAYEHRGLWTLSINPWSLPDEAPKVDEPETDDADEDEETDSESSEKPVSDGDGDASNEEASDEEASDAEADATEESADDADEEPKLPGEPGEDAKHLTWIDAVEDEQWRFVDWTPFEHPDLGPVEIGGFVPFAKTDPPAEAIESLGDELFAHLLTLAGRPAALSLEGFEAKALGQDVFRLEATVVNTGGLPTLSASGERTRTAAPMPLRLALPDGAELLAGREQHFLGALAAHGGQVDFEWLVRSPGGFADISLELQSAHAGHAVATPVQSR